MRAPSPKEVDVYRDMAATIYGLDRVAFAMAIPEDQLSPEETEQRRIGKNGVLSSGYGIGAEGFYRRFCRNVEGSKRARRQDRRGLPQYVGPDWCRTCGVISNRLRVGQCFAPTRPPSQNCGIKYLLTTQAGLPSPRLRAHQRQAAHLRQRPD